MTIKSRLKSLIKKKEAPKQESKEQNEEEYLENDRSSILIDKAMQSEKYIFLHGEQSNG